MLYLLGCQRHRLLTGLDTAHVLVSLLAQRVEKKPGCAADFQNAYFPVAAVAQGVFKFAHVISAHVAQLGLVDVSGTAIKIGK